MFTLYIHILFTEQCSVYSMYYLLTELLLVVLIWQLGWEWKKYFKISKQKEICGEIILLKNLKNYFWNNFAR